MLPAANNASPMTTQLSRSVAMYTITRNDAYSRSDVPKSFSKTITPMEMIHAASRGARSRGRGRFIPRKCLPALVNTVRLATSTAAKNTSSRIFENSAG